MPANGPDAYGQQWFLEAAPVRANAIFPAASVYVDEFTVFAFHRYDGTLVDPMQYDVSADGGQTFPTMRATTYSPPGGGDVLSARMIQLADGTRRFLVLMNTSICIAFSDTVLTLPTASTWTQVQPPGSVGAPLGVEVSGLNVVVMLQDGGGNVKLAFSVDGGTTFTAATTGVVDLVTNPFGYQVFASPIPGVWCLLNPNSGKIYRSTDSGANWGASVKSITAGDISLDPVSAIFATSATRLVACYKGQVTVSTDSGLTWTDKQNLTLPAVSPIHVKQGGIGHITTFDLLTGLQILGGATNYATAFNSTTTRGAMWRSTDLGETWSLINAVGGGLVTTNPSTRITAFAARNGRGVIDIMNFGTSVRNSWFNPNPPTPPAPTTTQLVGACSAFTVCPCPSTCD